MRQDCSSPTRRASSALGLFVVVQNAARRAFEIFVLTRAQRPQERRQGERGRGERHGNEDYERIQRRLPKRIELTTTAIDDEDIKKAAKGGVTCPSTAAGTASAL